MSALTAPRTELSIPRRRRGLSVLAVVLLAVTASGCMPTDAKTFLDRTNAMRWTAGMALLKDNDTLTAKAEDWAQHMAATGTLAHSSLTAGLDGLAWTSLGENIAMTPPTSNSLLTLHLLLAASSAHRANMLNPQFTDMGVGVATSADGRVWVSEVFADL